MLEKMPWGERKKKPNRVILYTGKIWSLFKTSFIVPQCWDCAKARRCVEGGLPALPLRWSKVPHVCSFLDHGLCILLQDFAGTLVPTPGRQLQCWGCARSDTRHVPLETPANCPDSSQLSGNSSFHGLAGPLMWLAVFNSATASCCPVLWKFALLR